MQLGVEPFGQQTQGPGHFGAGGVVRPALGQRETVSRVLIGAYAFDLVVRYPDEARDDLDTIRQTMIPTPSGAWVPLEALAEIRRDRGPNQISRENGQRKIVVSNCLALSRRWSGCSTISCPVVG